MDTYQNIYGSLILELTIADVETRATSKKFVRAVAADYANVNGVRGFHADDDLSGREPAEKSTMEALKYMVPRDVTEPSQANALNWLVSLYSNGTIIYGGYSDDPPSESGDIIGPWQGPVKRLLEVFYQIKELKLDRFLTKTSIENIKSFAELREVVNIAQQPYDKHIAKKLDEDRTNAAEKSLVYENADWLMYIPETKGAACALGRDTEWCTRSPGLKHYENYTNPWYTKKFNIKPQKLFIFEWKGGSKWPSGYGQPPTPGRGEEFKEGIKFQMWYGLDLEENSLPMTLENDSSVDDFLLMIDTDLEISLDGGFQGSDAMGMYMDQYDHQIDEVDLIIDLTMLVIEHGGELNEVEQRIVNFHRGCDHQSSIPAALRS
tara:strand:+ start:535 stop:1668 length:1134 start_codon:yes stop_codon:yes gene_type:complete